jgi:hypothetical protein
MPWLRCRDGTTPYTPMLLVTATPQHASHKPTEAINTTVAAQHGTTEILTVLAATFHAHAQASGRSVHIIQHLRLSMMAHSTWQSVDNVGLPMCDVKGSASYVHQQGDDE